MRCVGRLVFFVVVALASGSVERALEQGQKQYDSGNYAAAVELLQPFVRAEAAEKLTPQQRWNVISLMSSCHRVLLDFKAAFSLSERLLALSGPRSQASAAALRGLCLDYLGLKALSDARVAAMQSASIMEELSLQRHEEYGAVLVTLGDVDTEMGRYREALVTYGKAKVVLNQFTTGYHYGMLLNNMAICLNGLYMWNEAIAFCLEAINHARTLVGDGHPEYAIRVLNLGEMYAKLKEFGKAVACFKEALAIFKRVLGEGHKRTVAAAKRLVDVQQDVTGESVAISNAAGTTQRSVNEVIGMAEVERHAGRCQQAVELLTPLRMNTQLSVPQEWHVVGLLGHCYHLLRDHNTALPLAQRALKLALQVGGPRSWFHAMALKQLCMVHLGLKAFSDARSAVVEALSICEELKLPLVDYEQMLMARSVLDRWALEQEPIVVSPAAMATVRVTREWEWSWAFFGLILVGVVLLLWCWKVSKRRLRRAGPRVRGQGSQRC
jgi:tetratricopeptide (TPR) repeat protein